MRARVTVHLYPQVKCTHSTKYFARNNRCLIVTHFSYIKCLLLITVEHPLTHVLCLVNYTYTLHMKFLFLSMIPEKLFKSCGFSKNISPNSSE